MKLSETVRTFYSSFYYILKQAITFEQKNIQTNAKLYISLHVLFLARLTLIWSLSLPCLLPPPPDTILLWLVQLSDASQILRVTPVSLSLPCFSSYSEIKVLFRSTRNLMRIPQFNTCTICGRIVYKYIEQDFRVNFVNFSTEYMSILLSKWCHYFGTWEILKTTKYAYLFISS